MTSFLLAVVVAMELPSDVLVWLEMSLEKRAVPAVQSNPIQALVEALEALRLTKYLIGEPTSFM